MTIKFVYAM